MADPIDDSISPDILIESQMLTLQQQMEALQHSVTAGMTAMQTQMAALQQHQARSRQDISRKSQWSRRSFSPASSSSSVGTQDDLATPPDPSYQIKNLNFCINYSPMQKKKNMDVKLLEAYNGHRNKRAVHHWIYKMEVYFSNIELPESKKVALASTMLKDTVFLWWQRRINQNKSIPTWEKFRRALRKAFEPANAERVCLGH